MIEMETLYTIGYILVGVITCVTYWKVIAPDSGYGDNTDIALWGFVIGVFWIPALMTGCVFICVFAVIWTITKTYELVTGNDSGFL